ncbi:hypothetical protein J4486_004874 [Salmonella enterica]|nr:hypothetical protein [Salmonella enterica]
MLITLELLFCTDLRRSLATVGELNIERSPALESAISDYAGLYATTPPGVWVRSYKGRNWLTQSVPALPFFAFLADWRLYSPQRRFDDNSLILPQTSIGGRRATC